MVVNVTKTYLGCVELRDYNVESAIRNNEAIIVKHNGQSMTLTPQQLKSDVMSKSDLMVSKIGKDDYHLLGYKWNPDGD